MKSSKEIVNEVFKTLLINAILYSEKGSQLTIDHNKTNDFGSTSFSSKSFFAIKQHWNQVSEFNYNSAEHPELKGLLMVKEIIEALGGNFLINSDDEFARLIINLPM